MRHKISLSLALAALLLSGCAHQPLEWTTPQKVKVGGIVALQAVDCYQTDKITTTDGYYEANPIVNGIYGDEVRWYEAAGLAVLADAVLFSGIHFLPRTHAERDWMLNAFLAAEVAVVIHNERVGGGVVFNF